MRTMPGPSMDVPGRTALRLDPAFRRRRCRDPTPLPSSCPDRPPKSSDRRAGLRSRRRPFEEDSRLDAPILDDPLRAAAPCRNDRARRRPRDHRHRAGPRQPARQRPARRFHQRLQDAGHPPRDGGLCRQGEARHHRDLHEPAPALLRARRRRGDPLRRRRRAARLLVVGLLSGFSRPRPGAGALRPGMGGPAPRRGGRAAAQAACVRSAGTGRG